MKEIYTIGHSTRTIEEFIAALEANGIKQVVDIRTVPGSRRNPQYHQEALKQSLAAAGIAYVYMKNLGGFRSKVDSSLNLGWRNQSFRNYADYMQTEEFAAAVDELIEKAEKPTVIMCSEAVPWRCHRSLVGDALLVRGIRVRDIFSPTSTKDHQLTKFAVVDGLSITYPKEQTNGSV